MAKNSTNSYLKKREKLHIMIIDSNVMNEMYKGVYYIQAESN